MKRIDMCGVTFCLLLPPSLEEVHQGFDDTDDDDENGDKDLCRAEAERVDEAGRVSDHEGGEYDHGDKE